MTRFLYRLGRGAVRHRRLVLLAWIVAAVGVIAAGSLAGGKTSDAFTVPGVDAQRAVDTLEQRFPAVAGGTAQLVFAVDHGRLSDSAPATTVRAALADVAGQPDVGAVGDLQQSADGRVGLAVVQYTQPSSEINRDAFRHLEATAARARAGGVQMELGGEVPSDATQQPPSGQELIGVVAAVVVLLFAFGSVIAMGLPIGTALIGLATSIGLITLIAAVVDVSSVAPVLAAMIGLGVGIDYALFIVTRHREHLSLGMTVEESAGRAIATSGSAVLFAGLTVVIAICGLAIAGIPFVTVMGLMSGLAVLVMVAISLTLLPALLGFAGHKIDAIRLPGIKASTGGQAMAKESIWHRWGRQVSARPWTYLLGGLLVLGLLAAPFFSLRLGMTDNGSNPTSLTTRRAYDLLGAGFGAGVNGPLLLAVELDGSTVADLTRLEQAIAADADVQSIASAVANNDGTAAIINVVPKTAPQDNATTKLVHRLRHDVIPNSIDGNTTRVYVGGQTATFIDLSDKVSSRLPWFIATVIGLSVLLLMAVFRSIAVPLKAAVMNLLSIGAAYGVVVAIFQWGWLKGLFGVSETVPIVSFLPMMIFAILFGLSMDYEVFLLSRVREEHAHGRDSTSAVIEGISATARVITSAALIMICVFGSFMLGDDTTIKMFGVGLAVAVLVDATIVRIVLVPATMRLLGDWNWWLPRWLDRVLPRLDVEGGTVNLPEPEYQPGRRPALVDREPAYAGS